MKLNQGKADFQPVTITLETLQEVNDLWRVLYIVKPGDILPTTRELRNTLLTYLEVVKS